VPATIYERVSMLIQSYRLGKGINAIIIPITSSAIGATLRNTDDDLDLWVLHHDEPGNLVNAVRTYAVVTDDRYHIGPNDAHVETLITSYGLVRHVFELYQP